MKEYSEKPSTFYQVKGYPGLDGMASFIAEYIPTCKIYCEPFAGSGTTLKMAKLNRRNFIGIEVSSKYCQIIEKRLAKYNNQSIEDFLKC